MRIGEKDTDATYRKLIRPALKGIGIDARHVDDEEHNEDIDDRILKLLMQRDLVIADLTYARPSVYFEAGYAEAVPKPVVYTCRRDHFRGLKDPELGELKIHFDLQMKNIIPWTNPEDKNFGRRLKKRVQKLVVPIINEQKRITQDAKEAEIFSHLPLRDKIEQMRIECAREASSIGYSGTSTNRKSLYRWLGIPDKWYRIDSDPTLITGRLQNIHLGWFGIRQRAGILHASYFILTPSFGKNDLKELRMKMFPLPVCDVSTLINSNMKQREIKEHIVICNLGKTDLTKSSAILSEFSFHQNGKRASWHTKFDLLLHPKKRFDRAFAVAVHNDHFIGRATGDKKREYQKIESTFSYKDRAFLLPIRCTIIISVVDSIKSIQDFKKRLHKIIVVS